MICQRCHDDKDVQTYATDLDDPQTVTLCRTCVHAYGTIPDGEGGESVLYYPESPDTDLLDLCLEEGLFGRIVDIARFLGHKSPSHLYRVSNGKGNLSNGDRDTLIQHWRETHQPSPIFCPVIEDTMPGRRTLILEKEGGGVERIALTVVNARWVISR